MQPDTEICGLLSPPLPQNTEGTCPVIETQSVKPIVSKKVVGQKILSNFSSAYLGNRTHSTPRSIELHGCPVG